MQRVNAKLFFNSSTLLSASPSMQLLIFVDSTSWTLLLAVKWPNWWLERNILCLNTMQCNATQLQAMTCTLVNVHHGIVKPSLCPFTWRVLHRCDAHPLIALWMSVICRAECEWDSESNRCIVVWLPNKRSFYSPGWWVVLSLNKGRQSAHPIPPSSSAAAEKFQTNGGGMVWYNRRQIGRCDSFRLDWIACSGWIGFVIAIGKPKTVTYRKFTYARAIWEFLSTSTTRSTNSFYYKLQ